MQSLCLSTSAFPSVPSPHSTTAFQEDSLPPTPAPIGAHREENTMRCSSLSNSAESLCSVRSSCSSRSAAEREAERREARRLLDVSVAKIQGPNQPLRRHLLVYNTVKALQRDLDCLDEEELYVSLTEPAPVDSAMEVDHWLAISEAALSSGQKKSSTNNQEKEGEEPAAKEDEMQWLWSTPDENKNVNLEPVWAWPSCGASAGEFSCGGGVGGFPSLQPSSSSAFAWSFPSSDPLGGPHSSSLRDDDAFWWSGGSGSSASPLDSHLSTRDFLHLLPIHA